METNLTGIFLLFNFALVFAATIKNVPNAIGGVEVESISWFPYQTAIYSRYDFRSNLCSGAIITEKLVITCAHCLVGSNQASVFYGSDNLAALDFSKNQVVEKTSYRIHPQYSQYINDVALIILNDIIVFNGKTTIKYFYI